jgi:hypothetical protein
MRGLTGTLVIFLLAVLVLVAYVMLGRAQVTAALSKVRAENKDLRVQVQEIQLKSQELPKLRAELPTWRKQLKLLKIAVPEKIEDDTFFAALADQMKQQGVDLLRIDMAKSTGWLSKASESQLSKLQDLGVDVATAKQIKVAFYSINLIGNFDKVISAFENLKKYRRLYSIDEVAGPAGGSGGTVTQITDPDITPIQVTGKIFFGVPPDYLSIAELDKVFADAVAVPVARAVKSGVTHTATKVRKGEYGAQAGGRAGQPAPAAGGSGGKESKR